MPKIGTFQNDPQDLDSVAFYSHNRSTPYFILFFRVSLPLFPIQTSLTKHLCTKQ